jgi:hypothetical protein
VARLDDLKALRENLLLWMDEAPVDRKAALVAQFRATVQEIAQLEPQKAVGDGIDEIAARRTARRSSTTARPGRAKQSG